MAAFDDTTVRKVAKLARLKMTEERVAPMTQRLSTILAFVEQLNEVHTTGVAPMMSVAAMTLPQRADAVTDGRMPEAILANAPEATQGFFVVPKVVE